MKPYRLVLDLQLFAQEKTEPATPKKKQDARKKGQVARSAELPGALILFFTFLSFLLFGGWFKERFFAIFTAAFQDYMLKDLTMENLRAIFLQMLSQGLLLLAPVLLIAVVFAVAGNYLQIGFLFTGEPLLMKFSRLNPLEGAKRIFSMRSAVELLKTLLKMGIVGSAVYSSLQAEKAQLLRLARLPLQDDLGYITSATLRLGLKIGLILVMLALFDYLYQKYDYNKNLRMSKQEIKEEYKKTEGDPLIKGKIRERQRRMALQRMMQEIPKADVVITNPTHYAVALKYDAKRMDAPQVVAKGADLVALRIRELAREHGVATMENKPLARALFARVEIGETIPAELFQAVAEVLAYVYKLRGIRS